MKTETQPALAASAGSASFLAAHIFEIQEEERQLLLLGLALMAVQRPGFGYACREAAKTFKGERMFDDFMTYNTPPRNTPNDRDQPRRKQSSTDQ